MKNYAYILIIIAVVAIIVGFSSGDSKDSNESQDQSQKIEDLQFPGVLPSEKIEGKIAILKTSKGIIEFELDAKQSPKTVSNFVYLVEKEFYNGLTFHRVEPDSVVQGGDPFGNGTGGPGYQFDDEKVTDEYLAGSVAMANSGPNTNGSQFFVCLEDLPKMPKKYNLFGQVISGMDVVKQIEIGDKIESIIISIK